MKRFAYTYLIAMIFSSLWSCGRLFEDEKDDKFTISGQLFKSVSDEPLAYQPLKFTGSIGVVTSRHYPELGADTTDAQGNFSFTYQRDSRAVTDRVNKDFISIESGNDERFHIKLPWHVNIDRKFAQDRHSRIRFIVNQQENQRDSIFISMTAPLQMEELYIYDVPDVDPPRQGSAYAFELNKITQIIDCKSYLTNTEGGFDYYTYSFSRKDMAQGTSINVNSNFDFEQSPQLHEYKLNVTEFPKIDTIYINL